MTASQRRALVSGLIFISLGVLFLLEALDLYQLSPSLVWPVLLIAVGIAVLSGISDDRDDNDSQIR